MERLGPIARRVLADCERAMRAVPGTLSREEFERATVSGCCLTATAALSAGEAAIPKIATDEPTPRVSGNQKSATPQALGREADRFPRPFASRPSGAQVAANDNRAHTNALAIARRWLHSAQSADVAKLSRQ